MKRKTIMTKLTSRLSGSIRSASGFLRTLGTRLILGATSVTFSLVCSSSTQAQTTQTWCAIQYLDVEHQSMNSVAVGLGYVSYSPEICQDSVVQMDLFVQKDMKVVSVSGASTTSPENYYKTNTWSRVLNQSERDLYWCILTAGSENFDITTAGNFLIQLMPSTPEAFRIPNQIEALFQEQSLAASLLIELYSAGWQFLLIMAFIKFYRLVPFKST